MTPFISEIIKKDGWDGLFSFAQKQSLIGVIWDEVQDSFGSIPKDLLRRWAALVWKIEGQNKLTNELTKKVAERFALDGYSCLILKGQGLCHYFPVSLHRQTGDIDIWIWKREQNCTLSNRQDSIVSYIRVYKSDAKISYHHIEFKRIEGIDVEVHFTPSWMYSPRKNKILQHYFQNEITNYSPQINYPFPIPTDEFNLTYILIHIYRHIFDEGITLRQMMDYDMILRRSCSKDKASAISILNKLGLLKFVGAVMYVLHKVFDTKVSILMCKPNEKEGEWLYRQIIAYGDLSIDKEQRKKYINDGHSTHICNFTNRIRRSFQLLFHYPEESFWAIPWRLWHWWWRLRKGYL